MDDQQAPVIIGCDHAAVEMKETVKDFLRSRNIEMEDAGTHGTASVDYPVYGAKVASAVSEGRHRRGILLCGTGLGMSMVANRFSGVRAALCNDLFAASMARRHNDANVLVLGGRVLGDVLAVEIVRVWLDTPFEGDRHQRRLDQFHRREDMTGGQ
jgi:ribose 5-phosphate isomerase B